MVKIVVWLRNLDSDTTNYKEIASIRNVGMWKVAENTMEDRKANEEILNMLKIKMYAIPAIKKRKTVYFGHMIRSDNMQRVLVDGQGQGKRSRRRPRTGLAKNVY